MGLDVYMYELQEGHSREELEARTKAHNDAEEDFYGNPEYENWTEEEKEERRAKIKAEHPDPEGELLEYNQDEGRFDYDHTHAISKSVEIFHPEYPDHLNKIGYWRSSYNGAGMNSVLSRMGVPDLYAIVFGQDDHSMPDSYHIWPDWVKVEERAKDALAKYDARKEEFGGYDCMEIDDFMARPDEAPKDEGEAMEMFIAEKKRREETKDNRFPGFDAYSNGYGTWYWDGIEVVAFITGHARYSMSGRSKSQYVIYKREDEGDDWYRQALEIVRDTAQHAIDNGPDRFYLHWSG